MKSSISPRDRVVFQNPPPSIAPCAYQVVVVLDNFIPSDSVCVLTAPGANLIAALGSELTPLTNLENTYDGNS